MADVVEHEFVVLGIVHEDAHDEHHAIDQSQRQSDYLDDIVEGLRILEEVCLVDPAVLSVGKEGYPARRLTIHHP